MENMIFNEAELVTVDQLKEGDVIVIGKMSSLACVKVLRTPELNTKRPGCMYNNIPLYKNVKCSLRKEKENYVCVYSFTKKQYHGTNTVYQMDSNPANHNAVEYINLNGKKILRIKE